MILEKNIFLIASIYFWLLFGSLGDTISCDLKKAFQYPIFRHFTAIISIFLLFVIIDKNEKGAYEIWKNTFILYVFYVLLTKSKLYFSIPIILLVLIDQTISSENIYLKKSFEENNKNKTTLELVEKYEKIRKYIQYIIIVLIIIGFIHYYLRQKNKFGNKFDNFKFIFDIDCKTTKLNIQTLKSLK